MQISIILLLLIIIFLVLYFSFLRSWQLKWGAANHELARPMPGDDIIGDPSFNATRAVTINSPPEDIYPWIVQMGINRAGWYSYDLLDNLGRHSSETILPEHQNTQIGDMIAMSPDGKQGLHVKDFKSNEWILWWDQDGNTSWAWGIYPDAESRSRLVTRVRVKYRWVSFEAIFNLLIEFFDIIMMRKCMLGIKQRAERMTSAKIKVG